MPWLLIYMQYEVQVAQIMAFKSLNVMSVNAFELPGKYNALK